MTERIKSFVGKISQETLMILAVGLTVLVSQFAGWNSLAGQIEALRAEMNAGDARLRQERREDVTGLRSEMGELRTEMGELRTELRGEMAELRTELRTEMKELRTEVRAMGKRLDRLTESLIYAMADMKRNPTMPDTGPDAPERPVPKDSNP